MLNKIEQGENKNEKQITGFGERVGWIDDSRADQTGNHCGDVRSRYEHQGRNSKVCMIGNVIGHVDQWAGGLGLPALTFFDGKRHRYSKIAQERSECRHCNVAIQSVSGFKYFTNRLDEHHSLSF